MNYTKAISEAVPQLDSMFDIYDGKGNEEAALGFIISEADTAIPKLTELRDRLVADDKIGTISVLLNDFWTIRDMARRAYKQLLLADLTAYEVALRSHYDKSGDKLHPEDVARHLEMCVEIHDELRSLAATEAL